MTKITAQQIDWLIRDKYQSKSNPKLKTDLKRLKNDEPLDYVIGWKPFLNTKIDLSYKPLIPRTETEYWVEKFIGKLKNERIKELKNGKIPMVSPKANQSRILDRTKSVGTYKQMGIKILDIFAGSGCVGIAIKKNFPNAQVDFAEINKQFLAQIKINLKLNNLDKKCALIQSDVFTNIKGKYDYILANPPYIDANRKLPKSVKDYEPLSAIQAHERGLYYIKKFLNQAPKHLKTDGQIWLEFDPAQKQYIQDYCQKKYRVDFFKDQFGRWRFAMVELKHISI
ncbi:MAG: methyltransferase [Patescibacteria group bacterium]|nr:methyltransferase [Patescibacteria group bacterium]